MYYEDLRLNIVENGFVLDYAEVSKKETQKNTYDNVTRIYKKKIYTFDSGDQALKDMISMGKLKNKGLADYAKLMEKE